MAKFYKADSIRKFHPRTRKTWQNIVVSTLIKAGGLLISILLIPLTIDYLSKEVYGLWLVINSLTTFLIYFDVGIGNGLRNKVANAVSIKNTALARSYVSTAYLLFSVLQASGIFIFLLFYQLIPWQQLLNTTFDKDQLLNVVLLTIVAMSINLVLNLLSSVLVALQESSWAGAISLLSNLFILIGTYILTRYSTENLFALATISAISPLVVLGICTGVLFKSYLRAYRPSFRFVRLYNVRSLLSLGYKFFFVQLAVVVIYYSDNLIISHLFGPDEVTTYNVAFRYFGIANILFSIIITPFWSAFTEAAANQDLVWMKETYKSLKKMWLGLVILVCFMVFVSEFVYNLWVGSRVFITLSLSISMGIFTIVNGWNTIEVAISNGLSKVYLQLYYSLGAAFVNIPLAIYFSRDLAMGSAGVIMATVVSLLFCSIFGTIQAKKLLSGSASGIWNK